MHYEIAGLVKRTAEHRKEAILSLWSRWVSGEITIEYFDTESHNMLNAEFRVEHTVPAPSAPKRFTEGEGCV